jgi:hypothetical protein
LKWHFSSALMVLTLDFQNAVPIFEGEVLTFHKITRSEMGAYLCSKFLFHITVYFIESELL